MKDLLEDWITGRDSNFVTRNLDGKLDWEGLRGTGSKFVFGNKSNMSDEKKLRIAYKYAFTRLLVMGLKNTKLNMSHKNRTDGKVIHVDNRCLSDKKLDDNTSLDVFVGELTHEAAHILHSDFGYLNRARLSKLQKKVLNILEDERIEILLSKDFAGYVEDIAVLKEYFFNKVSETVKNDADEILQLFFKFIRMPVNIDQSLVKKHEVNLRKIKNILTPYPMASGDVHSKALEVSAIIKDMIEKNNEEQDDSDDSDDNKGDGEGNESQSNDDGSQSDNDSDAEQGDAHGNKDDSQGDEEQESDSDDSNGEEENGDESDNEDPQEDKDENDSDAPEEKDDESEGGDSSPKGGGSDDSDRNEGPDNEDEGDNEGSQGSKDGNGDTDSENSDSDGSDDPDGSNSSNDGSQNANSGSQSDGDKEPKASAEEQLSEIEAKWSELDSSNDPTADKKDSEIVKNNGLFINHMDGVFDLKYPVNFNKSKGKDSGVYDRIKSEMRPYIGRMRNKLRLLDYCEKDKLIGMKSGKLDGNKLVEAVQGVESVYEREINKELNKLNVVLLIDESLSMNGEVSFLNRDMRRIDVAKHISIMLIEAFNKLKNVDLFIYGHSTNTRTDGTEITIYKETGFTNKNSVSTIFTKDVNRDGVAIKKVADRVRGFNKNRSLFLVLSDGMPNAEQYDGNQAIEHTRRMVKETEKDRFIPVQIGIETPYVDHNPMFSNWLSYNDMNKMLSGFSKIIQKFVQENI